MAVPNFWDNPEAARETVTRLKSLKAVVDPVRAATADTEDLEAMLELLADERDASVEAELDAGLDSLIEGVNHVELLTLLSGQNDARNCYFNIQAGTGGADACDWAQMMLRLYLRYFERNDFAAEELSLRPGEEAGIQSCSLLIKAPHAYGYLSCETGVHRLVRISPFSAQGKRETSFASVDVQPEMDEIDIEIDWDQDIREDTYRASGKGGQHVNKTSSAVRPENAHGPALPDGAGQARHRARQGLQREGSDRLGQRDPQLLPLPGAAGQGCPHRPANRGYRRRPRRRHSGVYRCRASPTCNGAPPIGSARPFDSSLRL